MWCNLIIYTRGSGYTSLNSPEDATELFDPIHTEVALISSSQHLMGLIDVLTLLLLAAYEMLYLREAI